jgi:predicted Rossmann fold nucleotide-binding protein DprA/Smf involved in DNA uptake
LTVVSGGARGVDAISMDAATSAGGTALGVLTHPLLKEARRGGAGELIDDGRLCLITPFVPSTGFLVANAMARNKVIYALSRCTLVVASDRGKGGTWSGATEAIRQRYAPVAVWSGAGKGRGNDALVEAGGIAVDDVELVVELDRAATAPPAASQLSIDL